MKLIRLLCLAAALAVLLPGMARAAPQPIAPADYLARLIQASWDLQDAQKGGPEAGRLVEKARAGLGEVWTVQTTPTPVTADLRPVQALLAGASPLTAAGQAKLKQASGIVTEHIRAMEAMNVAVPRDFPGARGQLEEALKRTEERQQVSQTLSDWFARLWRRLFGGREEPAAPAPAAAADQPVGWGTWIALVIGTVGIGVLGWNLMRTLSANAGGGQVTLRAGRAIRPDRPPTPDELWHMAAAQAAAGDYKEGLRLSHLALLQHLDRSGLLRYLPAQTNREHEWMLRRKHPDMARTMHHLNDLVESRLYSGHGATAEDFRRGEGLAQELWREGDAASKSAQATTGASSSASSS